MALLITLTSTCRIRISSPQCAFATIGEQTILSASPLSWASNESFVVTRSTSVLNENGVGWRT